MYAEYIRVLNSNEMINVQAVVTVFCTSQGVATPLRFQAFENRTACEAVRDDMENGARTMKDHTSRNIFAASSTKRY